jgi:type II secretory pathway pseudopilin PulG
MKTIIGLAIGIILTAAVIIPLGNARTQKELETQKVQIALELAQAEIEALKTAQQTTQREEIPAEPQEIGKTVEIAEVKEIKVEGTTAAEKKTAEISTETATAPKVTVATPKQTPSSQVTTKPAVSEYPKFFYENGKKYAYNTAYAEEMGYKTYIAPDDEPNVQEEYYNWENDPLGKVKGPFN